jgi:hypothetical protein
MTDDELRNIVREAIARHLGGGHPAPAAPSATAAAPVPLWRAHPSFGRYLVARGADEAGPCIIEPSVACNHCGLCQSHGY